MPSVNDPRHKRLECDVSAFLIANDFHVAEATYHSVMPKDVVDRLSRVYTPSALYLRTRADRVAVHKTLPICFEWECKTRDPSTKYSNLAIEAFPLAQHVYKAKLGVKTLYVYRDEPSGYDCGFWADALPTIERIICPKRGDGIAAYLSQAFPGVGLVSQETRGSGDPFAIINSETVAMLDDWRMEVMSLFPRFEFDHA